MRKTESRKVGTAGEWYVYDALASAFDPEHEVEAIDFLDSNGIDLAFYADLPAMGGKKRFGVSVKSRSTPNENNTALNLHPNDLIKCRRACEFRGLEPAFAFCIMGRESIDLLVLTLDSLISRSAELNLGRWSSVEITGSSELIPAQENGRIALPLKIAPANRHSWDETFGDLEGLILIQHYDRRPPRRPLHATGHP